MKLINKDAVMAEIDRRLNELANTSTEGNKEFASTIGAQHYELMKFAQYINTLEEQGEQKPLIEMKPPEESLGISAKEYNEVVNDSLYGKSKSADKVEPKFKVGDWVVNEVTGSVSQIKYCLENLQTHKYGYDLTNGCYVDSYGANHYHLWSIEDAKDGDVIACDGQLRPEIGIVKKYLGKYGGCDAYCFVDWDGIFRVCGFVGIRNIRPATKEQRDILFKAMADAGYEFDFEKKELKKIEKHGN